MYFLNIALVTTVKVFCSALDYIITSSEFSSAITETETTHFQAASGSGHSLSFLVFICVAAVAGGFLWFQSGV